MIRSAHETVGWLAQASANWGLSTLCIALVLSVSPAYANDIEDCTKGTTPDIRIKGCTGYISGGTASNKEGLATAHVFRAIAYRQKGQPDQAIADYTEALRINPNNALAYMNRGGVYLTKASSISVLPIRRKQYASPRRMAGLISIERRLSAARASKIEPLPT